MALDGDRPAILLDQKRAKNRKATRQPILPAQAAAIRSWLESKEPGALWPGRWWRRAADLLNVDLQAAGIAFMDSDGRFLDFHALRHTYVTNLVRAGTHPKLAQMLARHSDIRLTMQFYTHLPDGDLYKALANVFG